MLEISKIYSLLQKWWKVGRNSPCCLLFLVGILNAAWELTAAEIVYAVFLKRIFSLLYVFIVVFNNC